MRLTQYSDYGLRVLIFVGLRENSLSTIGEIAAAYGISRNHLMKVVNQLVSAGFVESQRGKSGGLKLAQRADAIIVGNVIRNLEPDFGLVECMRPGNACRITAGCRLRGMVSEASAAFTAVLDRYTLADILYDADQRQLLEKLLGMEPEQAPG